MILGLGKARLIVLTSLQTAEQPKRVWHNSSVGPIALATIHGFAIVTA
jgi:hypothetical protein